MSVKYHVNQRTSRPNICRATVRSCPVGGEHFDSKREASEHIEKGLKKEHGAFGTVSKNASDRVEQKAPKEDNTTVYSDGFKVKKVIRDANTIGRGKNFNKLIHDGRFNAMSNEQLTELKSHLEVSENNYSNNQKKEILRLFSVSSKDSIKLNPFNKDVYKRDDWFSRLDDESKEYAGNLPLGTRAAHRKYSDDKRNGILNSYDEDTSNKESSTSRPSTLKNQGSSAQSGDTVISFSNIRKTFTDSIKNIFRGNK